VRAVSTAANRIDAIIRHMREFWVDRERRSVAVVDLREAADRAFDLVGRKAMNRGIEVRFERSESPVLARANSVQLEQIVINLVLNAVQAIEGEGRPRGGSISVATRCEGHLAVLIVSDDGPGVPVENVDLLFDAFFSTKQRDKGTGLGLAIVKNLVESFDGSITHRDNEGGGATFRVELPRCVAEQEAV